MEHQPSTVRECANTLAKKRDLDVSSCTVARDSSSKRFCVEAVDAGMDDAAGAAAGAGKGDGVGAGVVAGAAGGAGMGAGVGWMLRMVLELMKEMLPALMKPARCSSCASF